MRSPCLVLFAALLLAAPAAPAVAVEPAASRAAAPEKPLFLRDVAPILDKRGCSVANCHGKFGGQGDLALSLLTLSPEDDYFPLVHGARGRRVNLQEPEKSLLLLKASGAVPHGGGMRFPEDSTEYRTLLNWIQNGAPFAEDEPRLEELTVTPPQTTSKVGDETQIKVAATWSDGVVEDVTARAVYASADDPVAYVNSEGNVEGLRWGGTAIQVRYLGTVRAAFFTFPNDNWSGEYPEVPENNLIDRYIFRNLREMRVIPSNLTTDEEFARRVYLDTIARLPTAAELAEFMADEAEDKRARLIDRLLDTEEYVDLRTLRLADMLRVNPRKISNNPGFNERAALLFHEWLRDNVARNRPHNEMVRDLLSARGSIYFNGPANYWVIERTANDRAETTGQAFLGVRLQCARCHKHPFDRWTTDDYWDFSAFHGKVRTRNVPDGVFGEQEVFYNAGARVINESVTGPNSGQPAVPTFLGEEPLTEEEQREDISLRLAEWVTAPDNPFFARAAVNRFWSTYFGRGLIHPVDDMRETSPPAVPGLLDELAAEFARSGYDTKQLIRLILNSRAYQLSAAPNPTNRLDDRFYSRFYPRPMVAQVLLDTINQAAGVEERLTAFPVTRAVEVPLPVNNYFLTVFGSAHREYLTDLNPRLEPNLVQTLHMMNSPYVNNKIRNGQAARRLAQIEEDDEVVRQAFLSTLSRPPDERELAAALGALPDSRNRQEWAQDLLWALMSSREFLFVS